MDGMEAEPMRLEPMRRLVLHLAAEAPLVLKGPEKERKMHAQSA